MNFLALYTQQGDDYESSGEYDKAIERYETSRALAVQLGDKDAEGVLNAKIGNIYTATKKFEEAAKFHHKSLEIAKEIGNKENEGNAYCNLGNDYYNLKNLPRQ